MGKIRNRRKTKKESKIRPKLEIQKEMNMIKMRRAEEAP